MFQSRSLLFQSWALQFQPIQSLIDLALYLHAGLINTNKLHSLDQQIKIHLILTALSKGLKHPVYQSSSFPHWRCSHPKPSMLGIREQRESNICHFSPFTPSRGLLSWVERPCPTLHVSTASQMAPIHSSARVRAEFSFLQQWKKASTCQKTLHFPRQLQFTNQ